MLDLIDDVSVRQSLTHTYAWPRVMIHYNVWFSFKPEADEAIHLAKVRSLLDDFRSRGMVYDYRLLKNRAEAGKSNLPEFQVIIEFEDEAQFGRPFAEVESIGIRLGQHGAMIEKVDKFVVEVFEQI
jgi:hypothetical protein